MGIEEFQRLIEQTYSAKDAARGGAGTFVWFVEEVGELARAIKSGDHQQRLEEFSDVCAWLFSLASLHGVEMSEAVARYAQGCPKCQQKPCGCG
jgi:NTP pyrophosphatase (non-canonical NTP hydrolase)